MRNIDWRWLGGGILLAAGIALITLLTVPEEKRTLGYAGSAVVLVLGLLASLKTLAEPSQPSASAETPNRPALAEQAASFSRPHQLPAPVADFTGRDAERADLLDAVRAGGATISGLQGMAGVGKTELAKVVAGRLKHDYPDAQLWVDLEGTSAEPLSPADALARVVQAFRPEEKLPEDEGTLRGLFCSVLHGKRALLVMDNARDRAQVEPLVPPAGSVLIVTSRQHFVLPGMKTVDLTALPEEKARELLVHIAPRVQPRADEVAELCARLPLALRAAASALKERPDLTLDGLLKRLRDKKQRLKLTGAEPAIATSYDLLPRNLQPCWRLLAVFPGDFEAQGAAAVWDLPLDEARDTLSALRRASLLEWNKATGRYRLHDLARDFAASRLRGARAAAEKRHATHYKDVLAAADDGYLEGGDKALLGLALLDLERHNIEAGQAWAAANAEDDSQAAELAKDYPNAGAYVLGFRQHPRERIAWLEAAIAAARSLKNRKAEGVHLGNLGLAYAALGGTRKAIEFYEQALAIYREIGDRRGEGQDLGNLGLAYAALGEPRKAIELYEQRLEIAREIGDRQGEATTSWNLGHQYAELGDLGRGVELMQVCVDYEREVGHPDAEEDAAHVEALRRKMQDKDA